MARNTGKPSQKGNDLISELQEAIRLRGGPITDRSEVQHQQQGERRVHSGIAQQPIPASSRGDRSFSPRSPGPRRPVIPGGAGDLTTAIAREIAKGHDLRPTGERRMRVDVACSPPSTPSRAHLRRTSGGGRHIDEASGNLSADEMAAKRSSKSQWYVLLDPHELEGVRASALNTSPSRIPQPAAHFAQEGAARREVPRTGSLDSPHLPSHSGQAKLKKLGEPRSPELTKGHVASQIPTPKKTPKKAKALPSIPTSKFPTPVKVKAKKPTSPPETRTIAIQTDQSKQQASKSDKPTPLPRSPLRTLQTQTSVEEVSTPDRRFSIDSVKLVRACSIAAESPSLLADNLERGSWGLSPLGRTPRSSVKRDKSLKQRREDERQIQRSRVLSNPYELSVDLYNKQVEMLEKRYGGRKKAQAAAKTIQQAYRHYQMNKRYQHLKRTHSVESRISRYLDHHTQLRQTMQEWGIHSNRARVMVIEDNESPEEGQSETKKAVRQLVEELNNADNQKKCATPVREASVSTGERDSGNDNDDLHRNNSNNVTPKPGAIPSEGKVEGPRLERKGSQTFVVTLTMCKQQDSESEDNIASEPSSSPKNTLTRETPKSASKIPHSVTSKTTMHVERTTEINKRGGVTVIQKESSTVRTIAGSSQPGTPTSDKSTKRTSGENSSVVRKLDLGEEIGETDDFTPDSDSHSSAQASMSPLEDAEQLSQVVWTESPLFKAEPPDFKAYTVNASVTSPSDSSELIAPLTATSLESELQATRVEDKPTGSPAQDANRQNNNELESQQSEQSVQKESRDKSKAGGAGGESSILVKGGDGKPRRKGSKTAQSDDEQRIQDDATSSDITSAPPVGVTKETVQQLSEMENVIATRGSEEERYRDEQQQDEQGPMTPVGTEFDDRADRISIASTVTSEYEKDVPAVTVASPEGSMKILDEMVESTSSSDSDMSDDDEPLTGRRKQQQAMQAMYNQQAARANKQFSKVHSNRMDSPVWKRKSMDTKIASSGGRGRIINGTPGTGRMTRSETGDSMSSESSGSSSKFTYEDTSSMADDSVDSLSGDSSLFDGIERHVIPTQTQTLSIPMTPMRKRRYRIGVNLFNKKPEKGIKFLIDNKFVENSPNEVAKFLLNRPGFSKIKIGEYLGNLQKDFNMLVLECYVDEMNFRSMHVDEALRRFQTAFRLPGEAQKIERLMEAFAQRYCVCNTDIVRNFHKPDTVFILAFAIIMLHTDLHNPNVKQERKMKLKDFVKNLSGIDDGHNIEQEMLAGIYERVKKTPFLPGEDHTTTVQKVEQSIVGNRPMLAEPHRRLVCTCSLMEVYDPAKKEKKHIREVFLFNDLLVVTKLYKKKNSHVYGYKKSFPLQGVTVLEFSSQYYPYGIRLVASINNKTLITFCGTNPEDRNRFVADLRETVLEVTEMEDIRIGAELERQKFVRKSQASTADSGLGLDSESLASTQNLSGSIDSLAPAPEKEGSLKRSALSNSLMDLKEAAAKKTHRNSAGSLDSGAGIELNATMPLPRKNNRSSVGFFSSSSKRKSSGPKIAMQLAAGTLTLATGMESEA